MYKRVVTSLLPVVLICVFASTLWAAEGDSARKELHLSDFFYALFPLLFLGSLLWWFLRRSQRSPAIQRHLQHFERSEQHMQRQEQLLERIAVALEKKDKDAS